MARRLNTICFGTCGEDLDKDPLFYDLEIDASQIQVVENYIVDYLIPFGEVNPEPEFLIHGFDVQYARNLADRTIRLDAYVFSTVRF